MLQITINCLLAIGIFLFVIGILSFGLVGFTREPIGFSKLPVEIDFFNNITSIALFGFLLIAPLFYLGGSKSLIIFGIYLLDLILMLFFPFSLRSVWNYFNKPDKLYILKKTI